MNAKGKALMGKKDKKDIKKAFPLSHFKKQKMSNMG